MRLRRHKLPLASMSFCIPPSTTKRNFRHHRFFVRRQRSFWRPVEQGKL